MRVRVPPNPALVRHGPLHHRELRQRIRVDGRHHFRDRTNPRLSPASPSRIDAQYRALISESLFAKALRSVIELPDDASAEQIKQIVGPDGEDLLAHLTATWETIGVMLYHNEITIDIVDDFFSGPIVLSWRKMRNYITALRNQYQRDTWFEWFQWLAERMLEREPTEPPIPAYVAHAPGTKSYERWLRAQRHY